MVEIDYHKKAIENFGYIDYSSLEKGVLDNGTRDFFYICLLSLRIAGVDSPIIPEIKNPENIFRNEPEQCRQLYIRVETFLNQQANQQPNQTPNA